MATIASVREFIQGNVLAQKQSVTLSDDDDIFRLGFVNSMMALKLVTFIEKEFDIKVADDELDISTFSTISQIRQFLQRKIGNPIES
ncbi:phosphopantetheine-binding protein [Pendulispora rubella]|uniref:Phosphopantetheine-binding protein n=1 Tax=Pendulispora rubella TaxID=2741070 RepID=A0ABZ2L7C5_9BACT